MSPRSFFAPEDGRSADIWPTGHLARVNYYLLTRWRAADPTLAQIVANQFSVSANAAGRCSRDTRHPGTVAINAIKSVIH